MGRFLSLIGLEDADDDEILDEEEEKETKPAAGKFAKRKEKEQPTPSRAEATLKNASDMKMIVFHPVSYEDAQSIADNLKSHKPIIVNMEELDGAVAQRVLDFLLGAVYALDGSINKISRGIFLVAPKNCDVVDSAEEGYTDL